MINNEYVGEIFIATAGDTSRVVARDDKVRLVAETNETIILGVYTKVEYAVEALKFIGCYLTDKDSQDKITVVPSEEDLEFLENVTSKVMDPADIIERLMEKFGTSRFGL